MVRALLAKFREDERGISIVEGMLVIPIVLLVITAMVELGAAMFQINQAAKATQIGARSAAVSSPIVGDAEYDSLTDDYGSIPAGDPTPTAARSVSCGAGTTPCDAARLNRLLTGADSSCRPQQDSRAGMCDVAPFIKAENVLVTYHRSGLGFVGRPYGPVSTVTVELRDVTFDFFILDDVINAVTNNSPLSNFTIPAHPVSMTSEDLDTNCLTC